VLLSTLVKMSLRMLVLAAGWASVKSQEPAPLWLGLTPSSQAGAVDLIELNDDAVLKRTIGAVTLSSPNQYVWQDALRCMPGYCLLTSSSQDSSTAYKVDSTNASVVFAVPLAGICAHMHFDVTSRMAYTLCNDESGHWKVWGINATSGDATMVGDVTSSVAGGAILPGQTTHCSATHHLYLGVSHGGGGKDVVLAVSTATGEVDNTTALSVPLFAALWANCDGSGAIGGVSFVPGSSRADNGTLAFGTVDIRGAYTQLVSASLSPGYLPNGVLTATSDRGTSGNYYAALAYPSGHTTNTSGAEGFMWLIDPLGSDPGVDEVSEFGYNLISASWERSNW
jgi:hypothetical protein